MIDEMSACKVEQKSDVENLGWPVSNLCYITYIHDCLHTDANAVMAGFTNLVQLLWFRTPLRFLDEYSNGGSRSRNHLWKNTY